MSTVNELREHYDTTDMAESTSDAVREEPVEEVLVSTSIRLTKTVMDRVRAQAEQIGVPATTLMRQWITDRLDGSQGQAVVTVAELERLIALHSHTIAS